RHRDVGTLRRGARALDTGRGRAPGLARSAPRGHRLGPRRGAPPRGVEHRSARPGRRRPAPRLPVDPGRHHVHPRARALGRARMTEAPAPPVERPPKPRRPATNTRRLRTGAIALVAVAGAAALPLLVVKASRTIANSKAGRTATTVPPPTATVPD